MPSYNTEARDLPTLSKENLRWTGYTKNASGRKPAHRARLYGEGAGDGANGTKLRSSQFTVASASTIGAIPASNGESVPRGPLPPPIVTCVPFALCVECCPGIGTKLSRAARG